MAEATAQQEAKTEEASEQAKAPEPAYLTLWFDDRGDLKFKSTGLTLYAIIGVLRAAVRRFEGNLGAAQKEPANIEPPQASQPG